MTEYRTLRGFLTGGEPDEDDHFAYSATLRIFGDNLDFDEISQELGLRPTHSHRKGDKPGPRSPGYKHDMWSYSPAMSEARPLNEHIDALWAAIRPAKMFLREMKRRASVDSILAIAPTSITQASRCRTPVWKCLWSWRFRLVCQSLLREMANTPLQRTAAKGFLGFKGVGRRS